MRVFCPRCGTTPPVEDINIQALVATCRTCNDLFSIADQLPNDPIVRQRARVPKPDGMMVSSTGDVLTLTRRWFTPAAFILVFFCVFWDGFLVVWYALTLTSRHVDVVALLFPMLHVLAGAFLTYFCVCLFVNRTVFTLTRRDLSIRHVPLPTPGNRTLEISQVDQFYAEEVRGNKGSRSYTLSVLLKDGKKVRLLGGLPDASSALYLEQTLEQFLGIEDRPVGDELPR